MRPSPSRFTTCASSGQDGRLDRLAHLAKESDGELVSGVQRPLGEAHEVGEEDRDINFASTSTLSLRKSLPALKSRGPKLSRDAGLVWPEGRELTEGDVGRAPAHAGEPVVDLLLAECPLTRPSRRVQQPRVAVEPAGSPGEPPARDPWLCPSLTRVSLNQFARPSTPAPMSAQGRGCVYPDDAAPRAMAPAR